MASELFGILLGELQRPFVVIGEVEAVLQLGLGVGRIGIEPHRGIHHLRMVLAGLLPYHKAVSDVKGFGKGLR